MDRNLKHNLEKIFKDSNSCDHIFDAFQLLIVYKIEELHLFKTLLANPTLKSDEIIMFTNKLAKEFPRLAYEIYFWAAAILENKPECIDNAFNYFVKAINVKPFEHEPYLKLLELYNYEYETQTNFIIIEFIESTIEFVEKRSIVHFKLGKHYLKLGNKILAEMHQKLGEKFQKDE